VTDGPHLNERFGAATFPSRTGAAYELDSSAGLLRHPGQDTLLALFRAAINAELGDDWTTVTNTLETGHRLRSTSPVESARPLRPSKNVLLELKSKAPILFLHPDGEGEFSAFTQYEDQKTQDWKLHWIIGPCDVGDARKIEWFADKIGKLIRRVCVGKLHPAYMSGAIQWNDDSSTNAADFTKVAVTKSGFDPGAVFEGEDDTPFGALQVSLQTTETSSTLTDADVTAEGADGTLNVGDMIALRDDFIILDTDYGP